MRRWGLRIALTAHVVGGVVLASIWRFHVLSVRYEPGMELSFPDKVIAYCGHATMAVGGALYGYTEVAYEAALLHVEQSEPPVWQSRFPAQSPRVQTEMKSLKRELRAGADTATVRVAWVDYNSENQTHALALNPIEITARRENGHVRYTGRIEFDYPVQSSTTVDLPYGCHLHLEEGLYHALEEAGWLHPYTARWTWKGSLQSR